MPNGKGYKNRDESQYQPAKLSDREREGQANAAKHGTQYHPYETGAFGTNTEGSDYHDPGRSDSGLHGNFAQKDAHIQMLKTRGQDGQIIAHFNATKGQGKFQTNGHGGSVYNSSPIPETYQPASSQGIAHPIPIRQKPDEPSTYQDTKAIESDNDAMKKKVK